MEKTYLQSKTIKSIINKMDKIIEEVNEELKNHLVIPCFYDEKNAYVRKNIREKIFDANSKQEIYEKMKKCFHSATLNITDKIQKTLENEVASILKEQTEEHKINNDMIHLTNNFSIEPSLIFQKMIEEYKDDLLLNIFTSDYSKRYEDEGETTDFVDRFLNAASDSFDEEIFKEKGLIFFDEALDIVCDKIAEDNTIYEWLEIFTEDEAIFSLTAFNNNFNNSLNVDGTFETYLYEFSLVFKFNIDAETNKISYNKNVEIEYMYKGEGGRYIEINKDELLEKDDSWWFDIVKDVIGNSNIVEQNEFKEKNIKIYEEALKQSKEDNGGNV